MKENINNILISINQFKIQIVLGIIIILVIIQIIRTNNHIIKLKNKIKQSKSSIDVFLNQRFDLIPNLVECVKAYMKHEKELLIDITKERNEYVNSTSKDLEKAKQIESKCNYIIAVAENYPELKSSEQFIILQKSLIKMEDQIQSARRLYNGDVTAYNTKITTFPNSIVALIFQHKEEKLFEIEEFKRQNTSIKL